MYYLRFFEQSNDKNAADADKYYVELENQDRQIQTQKDDLRDQKKEIEGI
jgi:hypothetical protein